MKKVLSFFITFFVTMSFLFSNSYISFADTKEPSVTAPYAVLMDYETGEVLYEKNAHDKLYPASTTKLWTAYVILKHVDDLNDTIKINKVPDVIGSSMYLKEGESFTVKQLLDSLMVQSANDVSVVLAEYLSGSIEKFVDLMNEEAKNIGANNTHFNNPHGLPDDKHYTTAYDMSLMAREAMNNDVFRDIVKTKSIEFESTKAYPYERYFKNSNKFLWSKDTIKYKGKDVPIKYDIVDGIKTGFTDDAGLCLVSSAVKDDRRLISAVFKTTGNNMYLDSRTLLDYGFDNFTSKTVVNKSDYIGTKSVAFSKQKKLAFEPKHNYRVILSKDESLDSYTTDIKLDEINMPIEKGDVVGKLEVLKDNKLETSIDLIATEDLNSVFGFITENKALLGFAKIMLSLLSIFLIIILLLVIRRLILNYRKKNRSIYSNKNNPYNKKKRVYPKRKNTSIYSNKKRR